MRVKLKYLLLFLPKGSRRARNFKKKKGKKMEEMKGRKKKSKRRCWKGGWSPRERGWSRLRRNFEKNVV